MHTSAYRIAEAVGLSHPKKLRLYLDNRLLAVVNPGSIQEPIVEAIDRHLKALTSQELIDVVWDESNLYPLDSRLTPYNGPASGRDFIVALARAAVVRNLPRVDAFTRNSLINH